VAFFRAAFTGAADFFTVARFLFALTAAFFAAEADFAADLGVGAGAAAAAFCFAAFAGLAGADGFAERVAFPVAFFFTLRLPLW
jgi:hypothetical protein